MPRNRIERHQRRQDDDLAEAQVAEALVLLDGDRPGEHPLVGPQQVDGGQHHADVEAITAYTGSERNVPSST